MDEPFEPDVVGGDPEDGGTPPPDDGEQETTPAGDPAEPAGDEPADGSTDVDDDTPEGETPPVSGGSERFQKLLAKYGNDPEKMVDAFWNQANSLSAMDRKIDQLTELVTKQHTKPEDEAKLIAEDPDVKEIGADLASLEAKLQQYDGQERQLVQQYGKLEAHLQQLNAKLEFAPDDITKMDIQRQISDAKREQRDVHRDWTNVVDKFDNANRQKQTTQRQLRTAEEQAKQKREQARQQEGNTRTASQQTRAEFDTAFSAEAGSYGISADSQPFAVLKESLRARLVTYLNSRRGQPGIDITGAVGALMKEHADALNIKKKFPAASRQKAGVTTQPAGAPANGKGRKPPTEKDPDYWHPKNIRERAKTMLGG